MGGKARKKAQRQRRAVAGGGHQGGGRPSGATVKLDDCELPSSGVAIISAADERTARQVRELVEYVLECGEACDIDDPGTSIECLLPAELVEMLVASDTQCAARRLGLPPALLLPHQIDGAADAGRAELNEIIVCDRATARGWSA
jgi:hypothetical protein